MHLLDTNDRPTAYLVTLHILCSCQRLAQKTCTDVITSSEKQEACFWSLGYLRASLLCYCGILIEVRGVQRQPWAVYETSVERGETFTLDVILAGSSGKQLFAVTFK